MYARFAGNGTPYSLSMKLVRTIFTSLLTLCLVVCMLAATVTPARAAVSLDLDEVFAKLVTTLGISTDIYNSYATKYGESLPIVYETASDSAYLALGGDTASGYGADGYTDGNYSNSYADKFATHLGLYNEYNNLCIWAHRDGGKVRYAFAPWDLDVSWGVDDGRNSEIWYTFQLFNRLLRTDCGGMMRRRTQEIWQEMRELAFNEANVERLMAQYDQELNNSGAFYRNAVRWVRNTEFLDTYEVFAYAVSRFDMMDRRIDEIAGETFAGRQIEVDFYETRDAGELDAHMSALE